MVHGGGVANTVSAKSLTVHLASLDWQLLTPCFQERQTCNSLSRGKVTLEHLHPWEGRAEAAADSTTGWHCSGQCSSSGIFCACWFGIWDLAEPLRGRVRLIPRTVTSGRTKRLQGAASVFIGVAMRYFLSVPITILMHIYWLNK